MLTLVFVNGENISETKAETLIRISICFLLLTATSMMLFSVCYKKSLNQRGYIEDKETPSGWTSGMATKCSIKKLLYNVTSGWENKVTVEIVSTILFIMITVQLFS